MGTMILAIRLKVDGIDSTRELHIGAPVTKDYKYATCIQKTPGREDVIVWGPKPISLESVTYWVKDRRTTGRYIL